MTGQITITDDTDQNPFYCPDFSAETFLSCLRSCDAFELGNSSFLLRLKDSLYLDDSDDSAYSDPASDQSRKRTSPCSDGSVKMESDQEVSSDDSDFFINGRHRKVLKRSSSEIQESFVLSAKADRLHFSKVR